MSRTANGEGSIVSRQTKTKGAVWDAQVSVKDHRGITVRLSKRGFVSQAQAIAWRDEQKRLSKLGKIAATAPITVPELVQKYIDSRSRAVKSTTDSYRSNLKQQIEPRLRVRADQLTVKAVQEWVYETADIMEERDMSGSGAVKTGVSLLRAAMRWAATDTVKLIAYNPIDRASFDDPTEVRERKAFKKKELRALFEHSRELSAVLWHLLFETGARKGEILGLDWEDLDLEKGRVVLNKIATPESGYVRVSKRTKGRKAREVPLSKATVALLEARRDVMGESATGALFVSPRGTRPTGSTVRYWWTRDIEAAGLEGRVPHELRHTWATMAIKAGVDIKVVSEILGHKKITTTMAIYQHTNKAAKRDAIERVSGLI